MDILLWLMAPYISHFQCQHASSHTFIFIKIIIFMLQAKIYVGVFETLFFVGLVCKLYQTESNQLNYCGQ
jgi:hypothetical protein